MHLCFAHNVKKKREKMEKEIPTIWRSAPLLILGLVTHGASKTPVWANEEQVACFNWFSRTHRIRLRYIQWVGVLLTIRFTRVVGELCVVFLNRELMRSYFSEVYKADIFSRDSKKKMNIAPENGFKRSLQENTLWSKCWNKCFRCWYLYSVFTIMQCFHSQNIYSVCYL